MVKVMFVAFLSLLLLTACSTQQQKAVSLDEALRLEGISITGELRTNIDGSMLDGIKPMRYKLDNTLETIMVYDFGSKEKRDLAQKYLQVQQQLLSSQKELAILLAAPITVF